MAEEKTILSEIESSHYLQTVQKNEGNEGFKLTVTDGVDVWEGAVSEGDLDELSTKVKMTFKDFVNDTKAAFATNVNFECQFSQASAQLVWRKKPAPDVKFKLGATTLKKSKNSSKKMCDILSSCIEAGRIQQERIRLIETENERLSLERQSTLKRLEKCVAAKEELEKGLYSKFVAVLNSKKERIRELEEQNLHSDVMEEETPDSPTARPSKGETASSSRGSKNSQRKQRAIDSFSEDSASDSEVSPAKQVRSSKPAALTESDMSLNLGQDDDMMTSGDVVARRPRRQVANKKSSLIKAVLPRETSAKASVDRPRREDRKSNPRKSGSGNSNKSTDLDMDNLLVEL